jgi:hypothetical protein
MSNNGSKPQTSEVYQETSQRIAERLLAGYKDKHPKQLEDCDMLFRLRVAHALLLKFHHYYFNLVHNAPTITSQEWLVKQVLGLMSG